MNSQSNRPAHQQKNVLVDLARLFLKLGTISFGGPAVHIAMMEHEVVSRRNWMTREEFLDLLGATNLIPGPNSTEMAIHVGHRRAGWLGLIVAGATFIFPAAFIVTILAWAYVTYGKLPQVEGLLYGVKPVIIVVVAQALWRLARTAIKMKFLLFVGIVGVAMILLGVNELIVLFGGGLVTLLFHFSIRQMAKQSGSISIFGIFSVTSFAAAARIPFSMSKMFFFFLKVGAVLFGSGYVLLAFSACTVG
jgi:chromate transporter